MSTIGLFGSLLLTFCAIPELYRTIKNRKCHIGWGFLLMWFFGEVFCLFYGFELGQIPLIINYGFNLIVAGTMLFYKIKTSVCGSIGRVIVSKTKSFRFESWHACKRLIGEWYTVTWWWRWYFGVWNHLSNANHKRSCPLNHLLLSWFLGVLSMR